MNLITIISHDLGRYLGCYGVEGVRSPNIDALAAESLTIDNAFCVAPQCSPSRAAMWTGRYPHANGVVGLCHGDFRNDLYKDEIHLAQILKQNGYTTWLHGDQHETREPARLGFDHIDNPFFADPTADGFVQKMQSYDGKQPFFAEICFFEPHRNFPKSEDIKLLPEGTSPLPGYLPDLPVLREDFAAFEASIATLDRAVGQIFDAVKQAGVWEDTIVIFTADHGIPFPRAKMTLYDAGLEVPLIVRIPGGKSGERSPATFSNIDFTPSILDLLGIPHPGGESLHGVPRADVLKGNDRQGRAEVYGEKTFHTYYDPMRCVRSCGWKLIANFERAPAQETSTDFHNNAHGYPETALALGNTGYHPPFELYHLEADPHEDNNLAEDPACAERLRELKQRLHQWMLQTEDPLLDGPIPSAAYRARLADLKDE